MSSSEVSRIISIEPSFPVSDMEIKISAWDVVKEVFSSIGAFFSRIFCAKSLAERNVTVVRKEEITVVSKSTTEMTPEKRRQLDVLARLAFVPSGMQDENKLNELASGIYQTIHGLALGSPKVDRVLFAIANAISKKNLTIDDQDLQRKILAGSQAIKEKRAERAAEKAVLKEVLAAARLARGNEDDAIYEIQKLLHGYPNTDFEVHVFVAEIAEKLANGTLNLTPEVSTKAKQMMVQISANSKDQFLEPIKLRFLRALGKIDAEALGKYINQNTALVQKLYGSIVIDIWAAIVQKGDALKALGRGEKTYEQMILSRVEQGRVVEKNNNQMIDQVDTDLDRIMPKVTIKGSNGRVIYQGNPSYSHSEQSTKAFLNGLEQIHEDFIDKDKSIGKGLLYIIQEMTTQTCSNLIGPMLYVAIKKDSPFPEDTFFVVAPRELNITLLPSGEIEFTYASECILNNPYFVRREGKSFSPPVTTLEVTFVLKKKTPTKSIPLVLSPLALEKAMAFSKAEISLARIENIRPVGNDQTATLPTPRSPSQPTRTETREEDVRDSLTQPSTWTETLLKMTGIGSWINSQFSHLSALGA